MAEPNTVVPTNPIRIASSLDRPSASRKFRNSPSSINSTMKEVPDTGSIPVSPITRTAIAPSRKVVTATTIAKMMLGNSGNPPRVNMTIIAMKAMPRKMGMW